MRVAIGHWLWQSLEKDGEPDVKLTGELRRDHHPSLRCDELEAMLIYSMGVSVDGFIADRAGAFGWTVPDEEQFRFLAQTRELGGFLCGRRLFETMLVWETDPSMRDNELGAAFADVWCAIPKVVCSNRPVIRCPQAQDRPRSYPHDHEPTLSGCARRLRSTSSPLG